MRAILFYIRRIEYEITGLATKPESIKPEKVKAEKLFAKNVIVSFITVEKNDNIHGICKLLSEDIIQMHKELKTDGIVLLPFAHLSNDLASSQKSIEFFNLMERELSKYPIIRGHFGSDKSLLLEVFGKKGNVRYREF